MTTCVSHLKRSAVIILTLSCFCALSEITHEITYVVACFQNGTTEIQFEFDGEEILYVDLQRHEVVYTLPAFLMFDPRGIFKEGRVYINAKKGQRACVAALAYFIAEEKHPPEDNDPPESVLYPAEEVQLGAENILICFVNHFFPPSIQVNWTKNDQPVSEGVSLSRYYPNDDHTFHQFSILTFTPKEGDIYSCTVEHPALERPKTRIWEPDIHHQSLRPDVFCGVGLGLGLLGVAAGTFLIVKGLQRK